MIENEADMQLPQAPRLPRVVTMPRLQSVPVSDAVGFSYPALDFYFACRCLAGAPRCTRAFAYLAAQSLEAALKCLLSRAGVSTKRMKNVLRHDLESLWREALSRSVPLEDPPPRWCATLNSGHDKPHVFRYQAGMHGYGTPHDAAAIPSA